MQKDVRVSFHVARRFHPVSISIEPGDAPMGLRRLWKLWKERKSAAAPHCGEHRPQGGGYCPQGGEHHRHSVETKAERIERAASAGAALVEAWEKTADGAAQPRGRMTAEELATEFRRALQACPELIGIGIPSEWIRQVYPTFCQALGLIWAPPFKDFAHALSFQMPRRRGDERRKGGKTVTRYFVPDPKIVPRRAAPKRPAVERGFDAESAVAIAAAPAGK
jgi:hypothetical protein